MSEPLTVVDEKGLIRGIADVVEVGEVKITLGSGEIEPFLSNIDGIAPSKHPDRSESNEYIFLKVPRGKWRIDGLKEGEVPLEVSVTISQSEGAL